MFVKIETVNTYLNFIQKFLQNFTIISIILSLFIYILTSVSVSRRSKPSCSLSNFCNQMTNYLRPKSQFFYIGPKVFNKTKISIKKSWFESLRLILCYRTTFNIKIHHLFWRYWNHKVDLLLISKHIRKLYKGFWFNRDYKIESITYRGMFILILLEVSLTRFSPWPSQQTESVKF